MLKGVRPSTLGSRNRPRSPAAPGYPNAGTAVVKCTLAVLASILAGSPLQAQQADPYAEARLDMVRTQVASSRGGRVPVADTAVLRAMRRVPRHLFVRPSDLDVAYTDRPLPIGAGQTISQPYIVAVMTEMLRVGAGDRVLEIGTGSGYQAAVLAEIVDTVCSVEILPPLGETARERLSGLGYDNVSVAIDDGYFGWPSGGDFDGIVVTAAASHIPPPLIEQLRPGARLVIPVGAPFQVQSLLLVQKTEDGTLIQRNMGAVRFVPLTRAP